MAHADIKLGYTCNNNCLHCVIAEQRRMALRSRGNQDRTTEEYKKELLDSRNHGCNSVTFTGGEPTLREDIVELITYAKLIGYLVGMQTNGRMFCYEGFAKRLAKFNINYTVALHGPNPEIHDSITRANGSYEQTVEGIKNLVKMGQSVSGKVVISKLNYKVLPEIMHRFIDLGVKKANFAFPHAQGNAWDNFDLVVPRYIEIKPYLHKVIEIVEGYNKKSDTRFELDFEAVPFCFMDGKDSYVAELRHLNGSATELKQLDGDNKRWDILRKQIKTKFDACKDCKYNALCEGPWEEYPKKYGSEEFKPII